MPDFAFYHWRDQTSGWRRFAMLPRRLARRVLLPYLQRQEAIDHELHARIEQIARQQTALSARIDDLAQRIGGLDAFGWDHVAMGRRLAAIEDHLASQRGDGHGVPRPHIAVTAERGQAV